jgi:hypothetical protein
MYITPNSTVRVLCGVVGCVKYEESIARTYSTKLLHTSVGETEILSTKEV